MRVRTSSFFAAMGLLTVVAVSATPAYAVVIAQTGFNDVSGINSNDTVNSPYQLGSGITAAGNGTGEMGWNGGWTLIQGSASRGTVTTAQVLEGDGALRQAAGMGTNSSANDAVFRRLLAAPISGTFTVDYHIRIEAMFGERDWSLQVGSAGGASIVSAAMIRILHDTADGGHQNLHYYNGNGDGTFTPAGTSVDTGIDLELDTWYKLTSRVDTVAKKWSLLLDDVEIASNIGFRFDSAADNMDAVASWLARGASGSSTADAQITYLDSVVITKVPEPSSLVMISITLATLFALRVRRKT